MAWEDGNYVMTEITAPDGYEIAENIEFEVLNGEVVGGPIFMEDAPEEATPSTPSEPDEPDTPDTPMNRILRMSRTNPLHRLLQMTMTTMTTMEPMVVIRRRWWRRKLMVR